MYMDDVWYYGLMFICIAIPMYTVIVFLISIGFLLSTLSRKKDHAKKSLIRKVFFPLLIGSIIMGFVIIGVISLFT